MPRTPAIFKQCDLERAIRAASKLHGKNGVVRIERDGTIVIEYGEDKPRTNKPIEARGEIRL
jgi:hypothetical protein